MQFTTTLRNNRAGQIGTTIGSSGTLTIHTGSPAGVGNSDTGTLLSTLTSVVYSSSAGVTTITATADSSAAASGTPGHARLLTSGATTHVEGTAGVGTQATATATVSGGAINGVTVSGGGSGYSASNPPVILITGGSGWDGILTPTITSGAVASIAVTNGGYGYSSAPTLTVMPPFDFTFSTTISLGGTVTLTSGSITEGNN